MALVAPVLWEPSADETRVRHAAELWRSTATRLDCTLGDLAGTAALVRADHEGESIDAFDTWWTGLAGPGDAHLGDLVTACRSVADALDAYADALAEVRRELLEIAASIAASMAVGVALAWATAGASAAAATATVTALTLQATALGASFATRAGTIAKAVALHATIGALEGLATYAIVEPLRIAAFHPNDDPFGSFELNEAVLAAAGGALVPGWKASRGARRAGDVLVPSPPPPSAPLLWGRPETLAGHVARHAAEVGAADVEDYISGATALFRRGGVTGLPTRVDDEGVIRIYDEATGHFGSYNADGSIRTFYKATSAYWSRQGGALQ